MHQLKVKTAKNFWEKTVGLIGASKPYCLFLQTRFGIHTLGVKFPIDILVLDKNKQVVCCRENLKPNRLFFWNPIHCNILELPAETIKQLKIKRGDRVEVIES